MTKKKSQQTQKERVEEKPENRPAPLVLTVSIDRESGTFGFAHNIVFSSAEMELNQLIEVLGWMVRELNNNLVDVRVSAASNGQAKTAIQEEEKS